ncbi:MAG: DEAD/DEAH box helicase, partial [Cyclobacteriaceae bacterium]|nr:DEAD/DEAH box helicase [Cyclobacteriaceae bacterium]
MKFKGYPISSEIKDQLQQMGLRRPTDIQHRAIPPILDGEDVLGIAQTGTG